MSTGGPIESVTLNGRSFSVAQDADTSRKLGGFEKEIQMNGDGTGRTVMTRVGWSVTGITLSVDDTLNDQEFVQDLQDQPDDVPVTITYASGVTYQGVGTITGEVTFSNQSTTVACALGGPGKLTAQ